MFWFWTTCAAHPTDLVLKLIKLVFLPPNTTSIIQLLDQEIVKSFKSYYKKELTKKAVTDINAICLSSSSSVSTAAKSVNLLDALQHIKMSWDNVSKGTIKNYFRKY